MRSASVSAVVALALLARSAAADTTDPVVRARELFLEGSVKAEAGDWEAARDRFGRSAQLKRAPLTLYNLGIAQEETGHLLDAMASFRAFLAAPVEPATQRYIEPVKADMAKLDARIPRMQVDVRPATRGAAVQIDGASVPVGEAHAVDPGGHEVVVSAPGFGEARERTVLAEGARTSLSVELGPRYEARPISTLAAAGLTAGGAALLVAGGVVVGVGASSRVNAGGDRQIAAGTALGLVGALALGAGITLFAVRVPRRSTAFGVTGWIGAESAGVRGSF